MLCEVQAWGNFFATWVFLSVLGLVLMLIMSGTVFWFYYVNPTYERWQYKCNPKFPTPELVRNEVIQMIKGLAAATFCPSLSLYLATKGLSQAYCGMGPNGQYGVLYHVVTFMFLWIACDFYEFYYHRLGHTTTGGWEQHKYHHLFWNPSPFAVIADEYLDQFVRSAPLVIFPLLFPVNIDMMFFQFGLFFYGYGTYLHWGYELSWPDAHHPWINTSFQHYLHHARSGSKTPFHTGFFFKLWDQWFGSMYTGECICSKCERGRGRRERSQFDEIIRTKASYAPLLRPGFWVEGFKTSNKGITSPAEGTE